MISDYLISLIQCPECQNRLIQSEHQFVCDRCDRGYPIVDGRFVDLRPAVAFEEQTKYLDESLHADGRHERVSPPLLTAGVRHRMLRRLLPFTSSDRVIDLGCGSGRALYWNRDSRADLIGIDASPYFSEEASKHIDLVVGDLRRLPVANGAFTKAISLDVVEHLSRDGVRAMLMEAHRVLDDDGKFFIYSHVRRNARIAVGLRLINRIASVLETFGWIDLRQERLRKSDHLNALADHADFRQVVSEAGFRVARIRYYTPLVGGLVENIFMRVVERWMARRRSHVSSMNLPDEAALRAARLDAKATIGQTGWLYRGLQVVTRFMMLDMLLFGRLQSGPFFAVLAKQTQADNTQQDDAT